MAKYTIRYEYVYHHYDDHHYEYIKNEKTVICKYVSETSNTWFPKVLRKSSCKMLKFVQTHMLFIEDQSYGKGVSFKNNNCYGYTKRREVLPACQSLRLHPTSNAAVK